MNNDPLRLMSRFPRLRRFLTNKRGNVAIIAALTMLPISMAVGMGVDYTLATRKQDQINGIADGAALSAVTPTAMGEPFNTAAASAKTMFISPPDVEIEHLFPPYTKEKCEALKLWFEY